MMVVYTTCGSRKEAEKIARALVAERLVACVNMWPVRSVYRWHDKVEHANEWVILCKTRDAFGARVEKQIQELHSYKMPVIEQWEVKKVSRGVEKWIRESVQS